jgi:hypothetical protein
VSTRLQNRLLVVLHYDNCMRRLLPFQELRKGYIALVSVILMSALGLAIMLSVIAAGVDASKTDFSLQQSGGARSLASSCAEEALQKILETSTTSSSGNLTIGSGTCSYSITSTSSSQIITVSATGVLGTVTSKIRVVLATTTPGITLSSWEEVADF